MLDATQIKACMDVIPSTKKPSEKSITWKGPTKIKLTKHSSLDGDHHDFIPVSWVDHVDQHVHLSKTGEEVTGHWQHEGRK